MNLKEAPAADAAWAVFFLTGRRLKRLVPYACLAIHDWTLAATGLEPWLLEESYAVVGDGAETAALVLDQIAVAASDDVSLAEWVEGRIVGKGITFDSGGLSLKPTAGMVAMKTDMAAGGRGGRRDVGAARRSACRSRSRLSCPRPRTCRRRSAHAPAT